jgi:DNA-binding HxlR family transcriptional regulator
MSWNDPCDSVCPVDQVLTMVGDRWTLLIMRELMLGVHRFDGLQAQTGMSSHLLAERLRALESHGLLERRLYEERPKRYEYHATAKGLELDPVLMLLRSLGRKWHGDPAKGEPAVLLRIKKSGKVVNSISQLPGPVEDFRFAQLEGIIGPTFQTERDARTQSFKKARADVQFAKKSARAASLRRPRKMTSRTANQSSARRD